MWRRVVAMAQAAEQPAARGRQRLPYRKLLNRISIQSKLILMLVACTVLAAAVVGAIAYKTGRDSLREAAINRLTNPALDPVAKIPEFKYCAVRVSPGGETPVGGSFGRGQVLAQAAGAAVG